MMDDYGNTLYAVDNWLQYLGSTFNPYGFDCWFACACYWPTIEGM